MFLLMGWQGRSCAGETFASLYKGCSSTVTTLQIKKRAIKKWKTACLTFDPFAKCIGDGDKMLLSTITIRWGQCQMYSVSPHSKLNLSSDNSWTFKMMFACGWHIIKPCKSEITLRAFEILIKNSLHYIVCKLNGPFSRKTSYAHYHLLL